METSGSPTPTRILVVDDYAAMRAVVATVLTSAGCTVQCANNGEHALSMITAQPRAFDLLVTDLDMAPGMWGDELVQRAREHAPSLPVLMMTGQPDRLIERARLPWLESEILRKPFCPADLLIAVRTILARHGVPVTAYTDDRRE